ncbi:hypothetical protein [Rahnella aceris]|uniref:hypothetical protein n=1 Tax=Rahnella sp. (strain Y9602) TaxID=2703885 RepID=UPI003657AF76
MTQTFQQLVIAELMRDRTPRTCSKIEADVIRNTGFIPPKNRTSGALCAIGKKPQFNIVIGHAGFKNTYFLSDKPKPVAVKSTVDQPARPVKTLAEISAEFERNLWAVRQGRGQA